MSTVTNDPYLQAYRGSFLGLRKWEDLELFWQTLKNLADNNWFVYTIGKSVPESPASSEQLTSFISEINTLLRREHEEDYCGIVYVDDIHNPEMVKIYDPKNLGVVCGYSDNPPLPGWIISRIQPVELTSKTFLHQQKQPLWQKFLKKLTR